MTYTEEFITLTGVDFNPNPNTTYNKFTQQSASVARLEVLPYSGFVGPEIIIDLGEEKQINSVRLSILNSQGDFVMLDSLESLNFKIIYSGSEIRYNSQTIIPDPDNYMIYDVVGNSGVGVRYIGLYITQWPCVANAYVDIDTIIIDYNDIVPPIIKSRGFYRYKIAKANAGKFPVYFLRDGAFVASQCINFREHCTSGKVLKFMDRNGIYRFFPFNEFWEQNNEPDAIGSAELFTDSIYAGQSNKRSLGYKNKRSIAAVAYEVTAYELDILQDLMTSPFVYLYIGTTGDAPKDWLLVEVSGTNTGRRRKGVIGRYEVTIVLPEQFNITML